MPDSCIFIRAGVAQLGFFYFLLGLNCKGAVSIMTLPEQTVEIAVRCQVGRLQGTLFRIKPVPLSIWVTARIYSTFTVFQTTAKTERAIITLYNRMPFRLMSLSAVLYHCLKFQKAGFLFCSMLFSVLPKTNPSIPIHF